MNRSVSERKIMTKKYKLLSQNGDIYESEAPGELGGNKKAKIYGKLTCTTANGAIEKGYAQHRVFFENESIAIAAGYRPCGRCMKEQYAIWSKGGDVGSVQYPWNILSKKKSITTTIGQTAPRSVLSEPGCCPSHHC